MNGALNTVIAASPGDRRDLFLAAATRLGTAVQNVEKDFWVCWTLDALFNGLPATGPRLLFKGETSLSKAFGLISRFSEDIDITVFREDLGQGAHAADLEALSGKKRRARLDAIRTACQTYIAGTMRGQLAEIAAVMIPDAAFKLEADSDDKDGQTLLFWYPAVTAATGDYIRAAVKIEAGAKSAIDPHVAATVVPYVALDIIGADLAVSNIITVKPERTFWDKVMILHGLRQWYDRRKELRQEGQRVSRHYYDIHRLLQQEAASDWWEDRALAMDCAAHARMFFGSADLGLEAAKPGTYTLMPGAAMRDALAKDYVAMSGMIFGAVPALDEVLTSVEQLQQSINQEVAAAAAA